jgi:acetoin utilization deacetylase AcuC-like enzyme
MHSERNYPLRKVASDLDIGLPDRAGDDVYLEALRGALSRLLDSARPDIVFCNAGVDPHRNVIVFGNEHEVDICTQTSLA